MAFTGKRYRRRWQRAPGQLHPLAIVGICLGAAILITVIVGNLLHLWLNDEVLDRLTSGKKQEEEPAPEPNRAAPFLRAYPFALGDKTDPLTSGENEAPAALAVSLNTPDGTLLYTSEVSDYQQITSGSGVDLSQSMTELLKVVPYICGVFYPQATQQETADLQYAAASEEGALLREFARAGASEILLTGLSFDQSNLNSTLLYLRHAREAVGDSAYLGVSVPLEIAVADSKVGLLPYLMEIVDFLALDMQNADPAAAETNLFTANYYLVAHEMRLLLTSDQTEYITIAEATLSDFQIITAPPQKDDE